MHKKFLLTAVILALTAGSGLSAYDAEYVVLADRLGVRLVTTDAAVLREAPKVAVSPEDFAEEG